MSTRLPGVTPYTFMRVCTAPAPYTPGRSLFSNASAFSAAPVAIITRFALTLMNLPPSSSVSTPESA